MQTMPRQTEPSPFLLSVEGVPFDLVHTVWEDVRELLIPAMERSGGRLDESSVLKSLLKREMQLWIAPGGAMVTQIATYPTGLKAAILLLAGGEMDKWLHFLPEIEDWARHAGCDVCELPRGRKGWTKMLTEYRTMVFMEKKL